MSDNQEILGPLNAQEEQLNTRYIVASDVDQTLYDFRAPKEESRTFEIQDILLENNIPLMIVSGNDLPILIHDYLGKGLLKKPNIIVGSVGNEIAFLNSSGQYDIDENYQEYIKEIYQRERIYPLIQEFIDKSNITGTYHLEFQPRDRLDNPTGPKPQDHKISMFLHRATQETSFKIETQLKELLTQSNFSKVNVVIGKDIKRDFYNIDIVAATKDLAVNYVLNKFSADGVFFGDSRNDESALLKAGSMGFIVRGAREDLLERVKSLSTQDFSRRELGELKSLFSNINFITTDRGIRVIFIDEDSEHTDNSSKSMLDLLENVFLRIIKNPHYRKLINNLNN